MNKNRFNNNFGTVVSKRKGGFYELSVIQFLDKPNAEYKVLSYNNFTCNFPFTGTYPYLTKQEVEIINREVKKYKMI